MMQFANQLRSRVISQFISAILRVLQKLIKYFNSTTIFSFKVPVLPVSFGNLELELNDSRFEEYYHLPHLYDTAKTL